MKTFINLTVPLLLFLECSSLGQTRQQATNVVSRPTEGVVLEAACDANNFSTFTNLLHSYLQSSEAPKRDASQLLFELLAYRRPYRDPQIKAMEYMHSLGADVDYESNTNLQSEPIYTPLHAAVVRGDLETVKWLVKAGAHINQISKNQEMTALEWAVIVGREDEQILIWLLEHGAHVQEKKTGRSLFIAALRQPEYQDLDTTLPLLLKAGADPYLKNENQKSAVDILADDLDIEHLQELDKKGVYRSLIEEYTPHRPPENSPFIGIWSNGTGGFEAVNLIMNDEGAAMMGASITLGGPFAWQTIGSNQAVIKWPIKDSTKIIVEWVPAENGLRFLKEGKPAGELLKKRSGTPPTTAEMRKMMKGEGK